jgi:VanZ family protein
LKLGWRHPLLRYFLPALAQGILILWLSSREGDQLPEFNIPYLDKVLHFSLFFVLSFLWVRAFTLGQPKPQLRFYLLISLLISCVFGFFDEFVHQASTEGRSTDMGDFVANCLGAVAGVAFVFIYFKIKRSVGVLSPWDDSPASKNQSSAKTGA